MHKHPTDGVAGAKPRVPGEVSQAELSALNHEYLEARNRQMASKAAVVEMALAERQGTLISKRMAKLEVSFILNSFRQRVMAEPAQLARKLVHGGLLEEVNQHGAQEAIRAALHAMLHELAAIPDKLAGAGLSEEQAGGEKEAGFVERPTLAKAATAKAEARAARRLEQQRQRRGQA